MTDAPAPKECLLTELEDALENYLDKVKAFFGEDHAVTAEAQEIGAETLSLASEKAEADSDFKPAPTA